MSNIIDFEMRKNNIEENLSHEITYKIMDRIGSIEEDYHLSDEYNKVRSKLSSNNSIGFKDIKGCNISINEFINFTSFLMMYSKNYGVLKNDILKLYIGRDLPKENCQFFNNDVLLFSSDNVSNIKIRALSDSEKVISEKVKIKCLNSRLIELKMLGKENRYRVEGSIFDILNNLLLNEI